jgi:hypothetical protein
MIAPTIKLNQDIATIDSNSIGIEVPNMTFIEKIVNIQTITLSEANPKINPIAALQLSIFILSPFVMLKSLVRGCNVQFYLLSLDIHH